MTQERIGLSKKTQAWFSMLLDVANINDKETYFDALKESIAEALNPEPSASDEELVKAAQALVDRLDSHSWKDVPHTGEYIHAFREAIARHCQPTAFTKEQMEEVCENTHHVAVSADAVEVAKELLPDDMANSGGWIGTSPKHEGFWFNQKLFVEVVSQSIQAYGDSCRLDGEWKMQEVAKSICRENEKKFTRERNDTQGGYVIACCQCAEEIDALSPETVCGGK